MTIVLAHAKGFFAVEYIPGVRFIVKYMLDYANYFFFVISGFLIQISAGEKIALGETDLLHFMGRRLKKLYPMYIVSNIAVILIQILEQGVISTVNVLLFLKMALMMSYGWFGNVQLYNFPTWFVCILMQCCLVFYFVAKQKYTRKDLYRLLLFLLPVLGYKMHLSSWDFPFATAANGEGYFCFFIGVLFGEGITRFSALADERREKLRKILIGVSFAVLAVFAAGTKIYSFSVFSGSVFAVNSLIVCPVILFLAIYFRPYEWLLSLPPFYALGKVSMSVYFWHAPLLFAMKFVRERWVPLGSASMNLQLAVYLILLAGVSVLMQHLFTGKKKLRTPEEKI